MSRSTQITKKSKCQANDGDLISNLPESVICHILSRLPTKDAVRTSILSKYWVYKWTSSYNIDITDREPFSKERRKRTNFMNFVERILRPLHDLKSFRLSCQYKYSSNRLTAWISTALRRNTESFELQLPEGSVLPRSLLNNTFLREFKLIPSTPLRNWKPKASSIFTVTPDNNFPNLTYLYLDRIEFLNELSNSDRLVFTFPVLRTLQLLSCKWSNANFVEIHSPALSTFTCQMASNAGVDGCSIKICGARLAKLVSSGFFSVNIILYESMVLNAALMNQGKSDLQGGLKVRKLLKGLSSVTDLQLSDCVCKAIGQSKQDLLLPQYDRLQRLVMSVGGNAKLLFELLHSAPSLKFLEIGIIKSFVEFDCDAVDPVPYCIVSHLEEVKINYNGGQVKDHHSKKLPFHLAKFLLKNGLALKKLFLHGYGYYSKAQVVEQLLTFPRASPCVGIAAY